jgi:hypothetical protein
MEGAGELAAHRLRAALIIRVCVPDRVWTVPAQNELCPSGENLHLTVLFAGT